MDFLLHEIEMLGIVMCQEMFRKYEDPRSVVDKCSAKN